jgi:hypothetical protein
LVVVDDHATIGHPLSVAITRPPRITVSWNPDTLAARTQGLRLASRAQVLRLSCARSGRGAASPFARPGICDCGRAMSRC